MRSQSTSSWWVYSQGTPLQQSSLLKSILTRKFPHIDFVYHRFANAKKTRKQKIADPDGVIIELKALKPIQLKALELMAREFSALPVIMILSPEGFSLLHRRKSKILNECSVILSEVKSLDYALQLPRVIEEVVRKRRLRHQNDRLRRMLFNREHSTTQQTFSGFCSTDDFEQTRKIVQELLHSEQSTGCALRIRLRTWQNLCKNISPAAQTEVLDMVVRLIGRVVRNSDRVLRSKEDEFTVFLTHAKPSHLHRCIDRLEHTLKDLRVEANDSELQCSFRVSTLHA